MSSLNLPLSFRGLTRLAKKHNVKLRGMCNTVKFGRGCPLALLAYENNLDCGSSIRVATNFDPKILGIEAGFEGWETNGEVRGDGEYREELGVGLDNSVFKRYHAIGKRLAEYSNSH
jgi:hypothetical protein